jgi:hypothetical protein
MFEMFTVITCPQSAQPDQASRSTDLAVYGTVVQYTCTRGYQFPDNNTHLTIICLDTGLWNVSTIDDCQRKINNNNK